MEAINVTSRELYHAELLQWLQQWLQTEGVPLAVATSTRHEGP